MALNDIVFVKGQGGLGRPLAGEDHVSGLVFFTADGNLPAGWSTSNRVKLITSLQDAENAGILANNADATAAAATYLVTTPGSTGDTIELKVTEPGGVVVSLGTYTKVAGDTTAALVATAIAAVINAGKYVHGYTATVSTATVTITAPKKLGIFLNSGTPLAATIVGTIAGTITQFTGGVASKQSVWHYHIAEFFRVQPKGLLYVGFFAVPGTYTFTELQTMQDQAGGKLRQVAVFKDGAAFAAGDLTAIQAVCDTLAGLHKPISAALYACNMSAVTDFTTLTDLNSLAAQNVSVVIGQDGGGLGAYLYLTTGKSVTTLGALLGAVALAKVSEDVAWPDKFNLSDGIECDTPALANGALISAQTQSLLNLLDDRRFIFLIKYVGVPGTYFNDSHTAVLVSSDYAYIENNRTIDKAIRGVYSSVIGSLNGPITLNADGTLKDATIAALESQAAVNLDQMVRDSELSAYGVTINPTQSVLSTGKVVIAVKLVPIGVARAITVNIGFTTKI